MGMSNEVGTVSVVDFTTDITSLLDTIDTDVRLLTDRAQLDLVADLLRIQSRLAGVLHTVLGAVDRAEAAQTAQGVPLTSWLAGEPDTRQPPDLQWQIRISPDGIAEVIPPRYVDQHQRPRRHQRLRQPGS